jgi:4-diphosphocytidyl-2-C-methyl-D-erythritol kinase
LLEIRMMKSQTLIAPAKINLALDVVGRREDGYHLLWTVMQSIALADRVMVEVGPDQEGIKITCGAAGIPSDERNTAWRAARLFMDAAKIQDGVHITLEKNIPVAAGLAGGSSDAAAVLAALDQLYPQHVSRELLFELAARIGADVSFCLLGGTALGEGVGEILTPLPAWEQLPILLCKPNFDIHTSWVFKRFRLSDAGSRPDHRAVLEAVQRRDLGALAEASGNVLELVSLKAYPELRRIKNLLTEADAALAVMSGSGPTIFGVFRDEHASAAAQVYLTKKLPEDTIILRSKTIADGPREDTPYVPFS